MSVTLLLNADVVLLVLLVNIIEMPLADQLFTFLNHHIQHPHSLVIILGLVW